jgi:hypothetical protein
VSSPLEENFNYEVESTYKSLGLRGKQHELKSSIQIVESTVCNKMQNSPDTKDV